MLLLELSMECESLARAEAVAACEALNGKAKVFGHEPGVLILETRADPVALVERLGLCHHVSEWLFSCRPSELEACAQEIEVEGPIRIRSTKVGEVGADLASVSRKIGAIVGDTRGVDLHKPKSDIRVVFSKKVHVGKTLGSIDRSSFEKRRNRYLPYFYPASLHPKFARALVNLSRVPDFGRLLDPFCGTGAIVAEAAMIGLDAVGSDISEKMVEGAKKNLAHLGLEATICASDVGEIAEVIGSVDGIATDPPYGKSTSTLGEKIPELYRRSFVAFSHALKHGAYVAIVVPRVTLLDDVSGFRLVEEHSLWVHRSLTRNFCLLERI